MFLFLIYFFVVVVVFIPDSLEKFTQTAHKHVQVRIHRNDSRRQKCLFSFELAILAQLTIDSLSGPNTRLCVKPIIPRCFQLKSK